MWKETLLKALQKLDPQVSITLGFSLSNMFFMISKRVSNANSNVHTCIQKMTGQTTKTNITTGKRKADYNLASMSGQKPEAI